MTDTDNNGLFSMIRDLADEAAQKSPQIISPELIKNQHIRRLPQAFLAGIVCGALTIYAAQQIIRLEDENIHLKHLVSHSQHEKKSIMKTSFDLYAPLPNDTSSTNYYVAGKRTKL